MEAYRRKGLAKAVTFHPAKRLLDEGKTVFSVVEMENENSRQLFPDMGFTIFPYAGFHSLYTHIKLIEVMPGIT